MGKKKHKAVPQGIHDAEFCGMLDGVASTVKAVSMLNRNEGVTVTVSSFDEQVVLPEAVRLEIIEVLKRHVEKVRPYISMIAKSL
ncbi:MAG: hypothetical protein E7112_00885 [Bacteroidales bacterium]|nr:hypothetical protein [Bacteroidales bacterium]